MSDLINNMYGDHGESDDDDIEMVTPIIVKQENEIPTIQHVLQLQRMITELQQEARRSKQKITRLEGIVRKLNSDIVSLGNEVDRKVDYRD